LIAPDSSVLIPALAVYHDDHERCLAALARKSPRLISHVAFETTSVLSRMPEGLRMAPATVLDAIDRDFSEPWLVLDGAGQRSCLRRAIDAGLRGGALYDALIAATAVKHGAKLISADRRAQPAYEAIGVQAEFIGSE
jgi:predicted nucleic acid-binding protein